MNAQQAIVTLGKQLIHAHEVKQIDDRDYMAALKSLVVLNEMLCEDKVINLGAVRKTTGRHTRAL